MLCPTPDLQYFEYQGVKNSHANNPGGDQNIALQFATYSKVGNRL